MNDVRTRTVVCCYRGTVGTDLCVLWVTLKYDRLTLNCNTGFTRQGGICTSRSKF
jgi:hypothetical protein